VPVGYTEIETDGRVIKHLTAKGSKSERRAVYLETKEGSYVLRRRGGNPFFDPVLEKLVGKSIHCKGIMTEHTLIMSDWEVTKDESKDSENKK
jgi:2-hydroxy-3-keto-5-methylthiopentenyl-1-phosphate phosphatase